MKGLRWLITSLLTTAVVVGNGSAIASESIIFKYKVFRESISVGELKTFSETGELSSSLEFYLNKSEQEPENLKRVLTTPIPVDSIFLYKFLNSFPGELALDQMSAIIQNPSGKANRESLRAAIVSSALEDDNIRLIEVMENYPTAEVLVEGDRIVELHENLSQMMERFSPKKL
jgi:hypothetical protein